MTVSRNSRGGWAMASTPSGVTGRGSTGAEIFSQHKGMVSPVKATGYSSR